MGNIIVVAIVVVLLIIGVLHYMKTLQSGCCGEHDQIKKIGTGDKDKNLYPYLLFFILTICSARTVQQQ